MLWGAEGQIVAQDCQTGTEVGPLNQLTQRTPSFHHSFKLLANAPCQCTRIKQHLKQQTVKGRHTVINGVCLLHQVLQKVLEPGLVISLSKGPSWKKHNQANSHKAIQPNYCSQFCLTQIFVDCGRKPEKLEKTHIEIWAHKPTTGATILTPSSREVQWWAAAVSHQGIIGWFNHPKSNP